MSSKNNIAKDFEEEEADKNLEKKILRTDDPDQIIMNFDREEEEINRAELEFIKGAEAEMKKRAQEGLRLREEVEAQKLKAEDEQRLQLEAEDERNAEQELKLKEEAQAKYKAEENQKKLLKDAKGKRQMQEGNRIKQSAAATKARDEEWEKFKEKTDFRRNQKTEDRPAYTPETTESFEESPQAIKTSPKGRALLLLLIAAVTLAGIWIFSVFSKGIDEPIPVLPKSEATEIEDASDMPESNTDAENQTDLENVSVAPEPEAGVENQIDTEDTSVAPEPETDAENQTESSSNLEIGGTFGEGIIFTLDPSGKAGKIAYSKDLGPMTWESAMKIHEQLGEGWRLPNMEELSEIYASIGPGATNSGQFTDELYWSNEAYDENQARLVRFSDGNTSFHYNKSAAHREFRVRAVRDFSR